MALGDVTLWLVAFGLVISVFLIWIVSRSRVEKKVVKEEAEVGELEEASLPVLKIKHSVSPEEASRAKDELKTLNLEKEVVSYALTRFYEAEAEGKISEDERNRLAEKYKSEMKKLERQIDRSQLLVDLHELEGVQSDLIKMFYGKFDELGKRIEEIRSRLGVVPKEEVPVTPPTPTPEEEVAEEEPAKVKRVVVEKKEKPPKTKAEEKIEAIREEVLKVLERLEQIETEA